MNTSEIISALKIKGSFPTSDDLFSDSDFLVLLNLGMKNEINPMMMKLNDEYLLQTKDYTMSANANYRLPTRIITIRDIKIVDSSGNESDVDRCFEEDRATGKSGYYIIRNSIQLSSDLASGTLRIRYFARPSNLVLTTSCGQITSFDTGAFTAVVSAAPSTFATSVLVDFVQNKNPYDLLSMDQAITGVSGTTISFASLPNDLAVGDWICIANESPVPLAPEEMHGVLIQAVLVDCLSSKKDKAYGDALAKLEAMKANTINMLDPRVNNSSVKMRSGKIFNYFTNGRF